MRDESMTINGTIPIIYKKSHCIIKALMTQIEDYCGCYVSYIDNVEWFINTTTNTKRIWQSRYKTAN